jgi:hypothetical protein
MHFSTRWLGLAALLLGAVVGVWAACNLDSGGPEQGKPEGGKPPYNILFIICDQEAYRLFGQKDYKLPAREALSLTFSAVCKLAIS